MTSDADDTNLFEKSCGEFQKWPSNLVNKELYQPLLDTARQKLILAKGLFTTTEKPIIYFWDWNDSTGNFVKDKVCPNPDLPDDIDPDEKLKAYLGDQSTFDPQYSRTAGPVFTKKDPQCRFVFLVSGNSRKPLMVTERMFSRLMTYHQVTHHYIDYVTVFGDGPGDRPRDLRFGGFSEQISFDLDAKAGVLNVAGRSGREYQICYNLKAPVRLADGNWSIRQAAIHHQFDIVNGRSFWIMTKGDDALKKDIERLTGMNGLPENKNFSSTRAAYKSNLAVHMMLAMWSSTEWREYIADLERYVEKSDFAVKVPHDHKGSRIVYRPVDLQDIQGSQDEVRQAMVIMRLNVKTLADLMSHLETVLKHPDSALGEVENELLKTFRKRVKVMVETVNVHISRAELLSQIVEDRKQLIIQHMQAQNTDQMSRLAAYAGADTIAMRIITVVTLFFLPATFVSTLFSTDIVKYQPQTNIDPPNLNTGSAGSFSLLALERWLEVALPLTIVTSAVAAYLYRKSMTARHLELPRFERENYTYQQKEQNSEKGG